MKPGTNQEHNSTMKDQYMRIGKGNHFLLKNHPERMLVEVSCNQGYSYDVIDKACVLKRQRDILCSALMELSHSG